jgi:hypothetical protein
VKSLANRRCDAIRSNQNIGFDAFAVFQNRGRLLETNAACAGSHRPGRQCLQQDLLQCSTVNANARCAGFPAKTRDVGDRDQTSGGSARDDLFDDCRRREYLVFHAEFAERMHGIRPQRKSRAHLANLWDSLEDEDIDADLSKRDCGCKAADSASDDDCPHCASLSDAAADGTGVHVARRANRAIIGEN